MVTEETKQGAQRSFQDQSSPETAFSEPQTERHVSSKQGPQITQEVRFNGKIATVNQEREPRKPNSRNSLTKSNSVKEQTDECTPSKNVKQHKSSLTNTVKVQKANKPKYIFKTTPAKPPTHVKVPTLPFYKLENQQKLQYPHTTANSERQKWDKNSSEPPHSQNISQFQSNLIHSFSQRQSAQKLQSNMISERPSVAHSTTRASQREFVDQQISSKTRQERLNQEQRAMKLSLLKA